MIRGLILMAVGGAALSIACFGVAAVRGPVAWHFDIMDDEGGSAGPVASRTLDWQGGPALTFEVPATIVYSQGPTPRITVTGPARAVDRVTLDGDTIEMAHGKGHHWRDNHLRIVVTAPAVKALTVRSAGALTLQDVAVDHLLLTVEGAASVVGHGRADTVTLKVEGAAHADLSDMVVRDADVDIAGAGHVRVGPTGHASVHLSGVGAVELTRKPASLTKEIEGIGSITIDDDPDDRQDTQDTQL